MKQKTRKIISRIGASLMLGMSLFNFGAIWSNKQIEQLPRRTKNIRQKEAEKVEEDVAEIVSMAEKNAKAVLATQQIEQVESQEAEKQLTTGKGTTFQQVLRYGAIIAWTASLGVIFLSVLVDYPISFGKGIFSFAPGFSSAAMISLEPENNFFKENEPISIGAFVETKNKEVATIALAVKFDPEFLEFDEIIETTEFFKKVEIKRIDDRKGVVTLLFQDISSRADFNGKQQIAKLKFIGKAKKQQQKVAILQEKSSLLGKEKTKDLGAMNFLEKTKDAEFLVLTEDVKKITCGKLADVFSENKISRVDWEEFLLETRLPKDGIFWEEAGQEIYFICAFDVQNNLQLLMKSERDLSKIDLFLNDNKIKHMQSESWKDDENSLRSLSFKLEEGSILTNKLEKVMLRFEGKLNWPKKGLAEFSF